MTTTRRRQFLTSVAALVAALVAGPALALGSGLKAGTVRPWWIPETHHDLSLSAIAAKLDLVVPEVLRSYHGPDRPVGPLLSEDYRHRNKVEGYDFGVPPRAVWQACRWEELTAGDIVRWRNPSRDGYGTLEDQVSVSQGPAERVAASKGIWVVKIDPLTNGYPVRSPEDPQGWHVAYRRNPVGSERGEVLLVPTGASLYQAVLIAFYRPVDGALHWEV